MVGVKNEKLFVAKISLKDRFTAEAKDDVYVGSRDRLLSDLISDAGTNPIVYPGYSTLPSYSSAKLIVDPNVAATVDSAQRISQLTDQSTASHSGTQSTDANKPVLSRADNKSNMIWPSVPTATADWTTPGGAFGNMSFAAVTSSDWLGLFSTAAYFINNGDTRYLYRSVYTIPGASYNFSFYARRADSGVLVCPTDIYVVALGNLQTGTVTAIGGGLYRVSFNFTGSGTFTNFGPAKIAANSAIGVYCQGFQLRLASADSDYFAATTYPVYPGLNSKKMAAFDGASDTLTTTYTPVISGGYTFAFVMIPQDVTNTTHICSCRDASSGKARFSIFMSAGVLYVRIHSDSSTYIGRSTAAASMVSGTAYRVIITYDGGTSSSGVKIYLNGVQADTANSQSGSYAVPGVTTQVVRIAAQQDTASNFFGGRLGSISLLETTLSAADRAIWDEFLRLRYFVTPTLEPATGYDDVRVHGILREIGGLGQSMGEIIAADKYGSITLDVTRGSYDFNKRLYDRFENDTMLHQAITVYSIEVQQDQQGLSSEWEIEFKGEVTNIDINTSEKTMTLTLKSKALSFTSPNRLYESSGLNISFYIPIVFGAADVEARYAGLYDHSDPEVDPDGGKFIYANNLLFGGANDFQCGSILKYFGKNLDGTFVEFLTAAGSSTPYLGRAPDGSPWPFPTSNFISEAAWPVLWDGASSQRIYVSYLCYIKRISGQTYKGSFALEVWEKGPDGNPTRMVTSYPISKDIIVWPGTTGDYFISAPVESFVVYDNPYGYFLNLKQNVQDGSSTQYPSGSTGSSISPWVRDDTVWSKNVNTVDGSSIPNPYYAFSALVVAASSSVDTPSMSVIAYQRTGDVAYNYSPFTPTPLDKLNLLVRTEGIKDGSGGVITGTASKIIANAAEVIKLLYYCSNALSLTGLDTTTFSPYTYAPEMAGATDGKETYRDIMLEMLENAACKLVPRRGTDSLALWAYGVRQATAAVITESDCILEGIEIKGEDAILNAVEARYNFSPVAQANSGDGYQAKITATDNISIDVYGRKENDPATLKYIQSAAGAERWANYKLSQYSPQRMYFTLSLPFWKNSYRSLDLMDILDCSHIDNPSYYGSASSGAGEPIVTTDGEDVGDDFMIGDLWRRAKQYKMRILSRDPVYSINTDEARIRLRLLVLDNPNEIF